MRDLPDRVLDWAQAIPSFAWDLVLVALLFLLAATTLRVVNRLLRRTYWRRIAATRPEHVEELRRAKREQTVFTLVESLVRYVVYGAAVVIAIAVLLRGKESAFFGASLVAVVVGFGVQRLLIDVVSGGLLLFEGHIAVGDFVQVHQPQVTGIVEQFSLRSTTLRTLSGDRAVIMNGSITAMTRFANGYRDYRLELLARTGDGDGDPAAAVRRVVARNHDSPHRRYLLGPEVTDIETLGDDNLARIELRAAVPPSMEWLVETSLPSQLSIELGDALVGDVDVFAVSEPSFEAYRRSVLVRE